MTGRVGVVRPAAVVVLAAGQGTRMRSATPKVLHPIAGRSLLGHVVASAATLRPEHVAIVVGHEAAQVRAHVDEQIAPLLSDSVLVVAEQAEQRGTGDAVRSAMQAMPALDGTVVVLTGDVPLLTEETLTDLLRAHARDGAAVTVLTAHVPQPTGLGRIIRDDAGRLVAIVEERDATEQQKVISEINSGVLAFNAKALRQALTKLTTDNAQHQEYLTDAIAILRDSGHTVATATARDYRETLGCNDRAELAGLAAIMRDRLNEQWMRAGVSMRDPSSVWLDVAVSLAPDIVIEPNVQLSGESVVETGAVIGPDSTLHNVVVRANAQVVRSHCLDSEIGLGANVGPFAYLRPGTTLGDDGKVGAFVEVKNSQIGTGSKVPHLTYVGDATIGEQSNIGASSVFVNYDGIAKHRTTIGSFCRTGSDTMFIAPVSVGDGAYTAAGSVITTDVPPGALAVARAPQRNIEGWVQRRRPGSDAANAAQRANKGEDVG